MGNINSILESLHNIKESKDSEEKSLHGSVWANDEDGNMLIQKTKNGFYGAGDDFDFEKPTAKATIEQLKKWGYRKIGQENIKEGKMKDILISLSDARIGAKAFGGGYGPFIKIGDNSWKNKITGSLSTDEALADHIGTFNDFIIKESIDSKDISENKDNSIKRFQITYGGKGMSDSNCVVKATSQAEAKSIWHDWINSPLPKIKTIKQLGDKEAGYGIKVNEENIDPKKESPVELAWIEFNKKNEQVSKTKKFKNQEDLEKFLEKLQEKDNLYKILGKRVLEDIELNTLIDYDIEEEKDLGKQLQDLKNQLGEIEHSRQAEIKTTGYVSTKTFNKYTKIKDLISKLEDTKPIKEEVDSDKLRKFIISQLAGVYGADIIKKSDDELKALLIDHFGKNAIKDAEKLIKKMK